MTNNVGRTVAGGLVGTLAMTAVIYGVAPMMGVHSSGTCSTVQQYAKEFITGKTLPDRFHFVTDPDLKVVNLYGLRWAAPNETAYPSTLVVDRQGTVRFVKISHSHWRPQRGAGRA